MYSDIYSVQILVSLLKEYNIRDIVLAPGGSDIPIIHSIENDSFFNCYSIVDERSLVYFAIGIAQQKNVPVACVCTSGTAVSNFLPGMTEANYQNVPIVAITADKNPLRNNQLETQKINQNYALKSVCKKVVELPSSIKNSQERWYCGRLINEALIELNHHGKGPVHINVPIVGNTSTYSCDILPKVKKINLLTKNSLDENWKNYLNNIKKYKRILVIIGQNIVFEDTDVDNIQTFFDRYNCVISIEHMANLNCKCVLYTYPLTEMCDQSTLSNLVPDLVISMGNNIASYNLKPFLRNHAGKYSHWQIDESGRVRDMSGGLTDVIECSPSYFFKYFTKNINQDIKNDKLYYNEWKKKIEKIKYPEFEFSNFYVAQELSKIIPERSILHLAILNSTRIMQFFNLKNKIKVYSNIGALGIDGCLSTFMGQAISTCELAFCLIGDLSFFYDMNAAGIRHVGNNVRIILINNSGGSEFHFFMGKKNIPTINNYISAEHNKIAKGWIESLNYEYYSASNKDDLSRIMPLLIKKTEKPIFVEVFTNMEKDAEYTNNFYNLNKLALGGTKVKVKKIAKSFIKKEQINRIRKFLHK